MKKETIINLIKSIAKSTILSILLSIVLGLIFGAIGTMIFGDDFDREARDSLMRLINIVTYFICFISVKEKERYELFSSNDKFSFKDEFKSYFSAEGKYLLLFYSIMAVLCEFDFIINTDPPRNPICFLCAMFFPLMSVIKLPILRSIVSVLLAFIIHVIIVEVKSYKITNFRNLLKDS